MKSILKNSERVYIGTPTKNDAIENGKLWVQGLDQSIVDHALRERYNWYFDPMGTLFAITRFNLCDSYVIEGDMLQDQSKEAVLAQIEGLKYTNENLPLLEFDESNQNELLPATIQSSKMCFVDGIGFVKHDLYYFQATRKRWIKVFEKMMDTTYKLTESDMELIHENQLPLVFTSEGKFVGSYPYCGKEGYTFQSQEPHASDDVLTFANNYLEFIDRIIGELTTKNK